MTDRTLLARFRGPGTRVTDDEIFATLRAAEETGTGIGALCAARGVTVPTYCVWRAKYGALTLADLRRRRQRERMRAGLARAAVAVALVIGTSGVGLWLTSRASDAGAAEPGTRRQAAVAADDLPPTLPPTPRSATSVTSPSADSALAPTSTDTALTAAAGDALRAMAPPERQVRGAHLEPAGAERYAVQVAAFPNAQQAGRLADQLVLAGHTAYVLAATLRDVEVFRVRVGPFASRQAAEETLGQLERDGYQGPWIAR
jgi:cell division septation protein DedD